METARAKFAIPSRKRRLKSVLLAFFSYLVLILMITRIQTSFSNKENGNLLRFFRSIRNVEDSDSKTNNSDSPFENGDKQQIPTPGNTKNIGKMPDEDAPKDTDKYAENIRPISQENRVNATGKLNEPNIKTRNTSSDKNCSRPAIEQFPRPLMSPKAREKGALIVHILVTVYLFIAIAIVCDEHFVPSLEMICERLDLSEDVAGATFMAAGSSAPEMATSLIAVFIAKDDIGISGVIGSAVFNILFVIAVCAIFAGHTVKINWWPMVRDCFCYCISICGLLITIGDEEVTWYNSVFLLILYGLYIVVMVFNKTFEEKVGQLFGRLTGSRDEKSSLFATRSDRPTTSGAANDKEGQQSMDANATDYDNQGLDGSKLDTTEVDAAQPKSFLPEGKDVNEVNKWEIPVGVWERFTWVITLPLIVLHHFSIPDCRTVRWRRWYIVTFIISMCWIALYSYIMVWMITIIGYTLGIPDTVMGLTFIAVGVSVPDALSSLCVVKQGFGDMAISNAIGSNVFDILICLGVPWFLKTAIFDAGSVIPVESRGLTYSTLSLFSTVVFLLAATHINNWKLDVKYGIVLLVWYLIFMMFASLYELNVFGHYNLPACESIY